MMRLFMSRSRKFAKILFFVVALGFLSTAVLDRMLIRTDCNRQDWSRSMMKGLEIAIKSYKTEYLGLPQVTSSDSTVVESRGLLLAILLAENTGQNARQIRFWDTPPTKSKKPGGATKSPEGEWELRDEYCNFYRIQLDVDGDGRIPNPAKGSLGDEPDTLTSDVIIYSAGKDGDYATWKDNVLSWR